MVVSEENVYQPPTEFVEDKRDPLVDLSLKDSTELWLIQWPINQSADFDGQQVSLKIDGDELLGSFEGSSGKSYEVNSFKSQGPQPMAFLSSASDAKIVGKISRLVSFIHYPDPSEYKKRSKHSLSQSHRSSMATSTLTSHRSTTPTHSIKPKNSGSMIGHVTPTPSSTTKITTQDSVKANNTVVTSTGSMEHSSGKNSKKKKRKTGS